MHRPRRLKLKNSEKKPNRQKPRLRASVFLRWAYWAIYKFSLKNRHKFIFGPNPKKIGGGWPCIDLVACPWTVLKFIKTAVMRRFALLCAGRKQTELRPMRSTSPWRQRFFNFGGINICLTAKNLWMVCNQTTRIAPSLTSFSNDRGEGGGGW